MVDVFRFTHPFLLAPVLFKDEEIVDLRANPFQHTEEQISQSGNVSLIPVGSTYFIFDFRVNMYFRDTIEKLDEMRAAQSESCEPFQFWPFWLYDQVTHFEVFWTNVSDFHERHVRGRIAGCWEQEIVMKEVVETFCIAEVS
jgi:hypothetical protein